MQRVTVRNSQDVQAVLHVHKQLPDQRLGQMLLEEGLIDRKSVV